MKQTQQSIHEELIVPKKQYEQPSIEVVELNIQAPLLQLSTLSSPNAGDVEEIDL